MSKTRFVTLISKGNKNTPFSGKYFAINDIFVNNSCALHSVHEGGSSWTRGAPDSGFSYLTGYRISRIVENYPAGLFSRIVVM